MKRLILIFLFLFIPKQLIGVSITFLIDTPGLYQLGADSIANPTDANDAIITVSADNVFLNLNGHLLAQQLGNTISGLTGVRVLPNFKRVIIENGNIGDLTGVGVEIDEGNELICLENMRIFECQGGGVSCNGLAINPINTVQMLNSVINSCTGIGGNPAIGFFAQNTRTIFFEESEIIKNDAVLTSSGYGCLLQSCTGISVKNCILSANGGFAEGIGLAIENSDNIAIRGSFFNLNLGRSSAAAALAAGVVLDNCANIRLEGCEMSLNVNPSARSFGLCVMNSADTFVLDCLIEGNKGGSSATGIGLQDTLRSQINGNVIRCHEATQVYGIHLIGTNTGANVLNNSLSSGIGATTYGIADEVNPSLSAFTGNRVFDFITSYSVPYPSGITLPVIEGSLSDPVTGLATGVGGLLDNVSIKP